MNTPSQPGPLHRYVARGRTLLRQGLGGGAADDPRFATLPSLTTTIQYGVFFVGLALILLLTARTISDLWQETFFAAVAAFSLRPFYERVAKRTTYGEIGNTGLVVLVVLVVLAIPVFLIGGWFFDAAKSFLNDPKPSDPSHISKNLDGLSSWLQSTFSINLENLIQQIAARWDAFAAKVADIVVDALAGLAGMTISFLIRFITFMALFAIMLPNAVRIRRFVAGLSPFDSALTDFYLSRIGLTTRAVVAGAIIVPAVQAGIMAIVFWLVDLPLIWLLTILVFVFAIIPFLGASLVTIPLGIVLIVTGDWQAALLIWLVHFFVLNNVDLVLRPMVTPKALHVPMSVLLIGFVGGLTSFGLVGLFLGPLSVTLFVTTLRIFAATFGRYNKEPGPADAVERETAEPTGPLPAVPPELEPGVG